MIPGHFYLDRSCKQCTKEENFHLARIIREGGPGAEVARERMITGNLRLVLKLARRYSSPQFSADDLVSYGSFGLFRAIEKYDPERGIAFSTYAANWIRSKITYVLRNNLHQVDVPQNIVDAQRRIEEEGRGGEHLSPAERMELTGVSHNSLEAYRNFIEISIDSTMAENNMQDFLAGEPWGRTVEDVEADISAEWVRRHGLARLTADERQILEDHFNGQTLVEIGARLGVSRERARQKINAAIRRLRNVPAIKKAIHESREEKGRQDPGHHPDDQNLGRVRLQSRRGSQRPGATVLV